MKHTRLKEKFGAVGSKAAKATPMNADSPVQGSDATPVKPKKTATAKSGNKKRRTADEDTEENKAVKEEPSNDASIMLQCKRIHANRVNRWINPASINAHFGSMCSSDDVFVRGVGLGE